MRLIPLLIAMTLTLAGPLAALPPVAKILPQADSPVEITSYTANYQSGSQYASEGIYHAVEYKNNSSQLIVAVEIGLVSFDVWNEFLDRTRGAAMDLVQPGATKKGRWVATAYADFSFLTGVAYVGRVRFRDGTIWRADLDAIAQVLSEIEANFDVARLKQKEEPK